MFTANGYHAPHKSTHTVLLPSLQPYTPSSTTPSHLLADLQQDLLQHTHASKLLVHAAPSAPTIAQKQMRLLVLHPSAGTPGAGGGAPHCIFASKKMTGSGSRMAASSNPLASRGPLGTTTLMPGTCVKTASGDCEW